MTHHRAHHQHIEWLEVQLAQQKQELTAAEDKLAEVKALVEQKQDSVAYFQRELERVTSNALVEATVETSSSHSGSQVAWNISTEIRNQNGSQATSDTSRCEDENFDSEEFEDEGYEDEEFENLNKRNPKDMLRAEFKSMTLGDAAETILAQYRYPLNPEQIAAKMFEPQSEDEHLRARNSLATELRRGAKDGRWKKIGRGLFVSNDIQAEALATKPEQLSRFNAIDNGSILDS
jgi:uncharacterized coiled-coil protein SlyX